MSRAQLKSMLLEQIKEQHKPFGLLFDDIEGGFTITGRTIPNAFNVLPVMVYRVYPDGREELVRGVDLIGTPLTVFSKIVAADDEKAVFNGICGAESGGVPVSAGGPAILVSQIEVQKKQKSQERPPILPAPIEDK
jgi:predicted Zn-dependent protease